MASAPANNPAIFDVGSGDRSLGCDIGDEIFKTLVHDLLGILCSSSVDRAGS